MSIIDRRAVLLCALWTGCSGASVAPGGSDGAMHPLEEVRAVRVLERTLTGHGQQVTQGRHLRLMGNRDVTCDAWISGTRHCLEYVTEADRARFGTSLPTRRTPGALVLAPGAGADQGSDLLVLDAQDYAYEPDPSRQGEGHPTLQEVEDRLERAVLDYLSWLRENGRM